MLKTIARWLLACFDALSRLRAPEPEPVRYIARSPLPVLPQPKPKPSRAERKRALVLEWSNRIRAALPDDVSAGRCEIEAGPRVARIRFYPEQHMRAIRAFLASPDTFYLVPWSLDVSPNVEIAGKSLTVEAAWCDKWADRRFELTAADVGDLKHGEFHIGVNGQGKRITAALSDSTPHFLIAGLTGSGKSVLMRSIAFQLSMSESRIVLIDGKYGATLRGLDTLPGTIGPCAFAQSDAAAAFGWVLAEMEHRYALLRDGHNAAHWPRIAVVCDEFVDFDRNSVKDAIDRVARQGREARVHLILSTQHPTKANLESDARRNLPGRVALKVEDAIASRVCVGAEWPRADHLLGCGDAFYIAPGTVERLQAYIATDALIESESGLPRDLETWHAPHGGIPAPVELFGRAVTQTPDPYLAIARECVKAGQGRGTLAARIREAGLPGISNARMSGLLKAARGGPSARIDLS